MSQVKVECNLEKRTIYFTGLVNEESQFEIIKAINEINNEDKETIKYIKTVFDNVSYQPKPIHLHINSYGGGVYDCLSIIETMDNSIAPIYTYCTGKAMSAGFDMFISGKKRFIGKLATLMYHDMSGGNYGKVEDLKDNLEHTIDLSKIFSDMVVKKTAITEKEIKECNKMKKDWFILAEEAIKLKCADAYIGEVEKNN